MQHRLLVPVLCCAAILCLLLVSCSSVADPLVSSSADTQEKENLEIVTTIFPLYDWVKEMSKDTDAQITWLTDTGVDLHSYQPSAADIRKISDCDLLLYVGGTSDEWITEVLAEISNPKMHVVCLLDELSDLVLEEEQTEGMMAQSHSQKHTDPDEHIWMSPSCAAVCCQCIAEELEEIAPDNKELYEANTSAYLSELDTLNAAYEEMTAQAARDTLLVADRFPFRYLTNEYHLNYYAAFSGCSAETGASFETIIFLADQIDEQNLPVILKLKESTPDLAETIRSASGKNNVQILSMDAMQSVTASDVENGVSYLSIMEDNFTVLQQALNE